MKKKESLLTAKKLITILKKLPGNARIYVNEKPVKIVKILDDERWYKKGMAHTILGLK